MQLAITARVHPGEADQLRPRDGGVEAPRRHGSAPRAAGHAHGERRLHAEFAERIFEQIQGFGSYGFPNRTRQLRDDHLRQLLAEMHEPAAFSCALLTRCRWGSTAPHWSPTRAANGI